MLSQLLKTHNLAARVPALGSIPVALCVCWTASTPMVV